MPHRRLDYAHMHMSRMLQVASSTTVSATGPRATASSPVRLVLFDVFDTLCTPRLPIHEQYADEAHRAGIRSVTAQSVRAGFKPAFKEMAQVHPLYGKHSNPPISPEQWWSDLIRRCMTHAGADEQELAENGEKLTTALLERFESNVGYRDFPETISALNRLRELGVKTSVVSNADPRILRTLNALDILSLLSHPPTLSWAVESSKPSPEIFAHACDACDETIGEGIIMVGDELEADFRGATGAGIEGRLIRRYGEWSDGAVREMIEDLGGVNVVRGLDEVVSEVEQRNRHLI